RTGVGAMIRGAPTPRPVRTDVRRSVPVASRRSSVRTRPAVGRSGVLGEFVQEYARGVVRVPPSLHDLLGQGVQSAVGLESSQASTQPLQNDRLDLRTGPGTASLGQFPGGLQMGTVLFQPSPELVDAFPLGGDRHDDRGLPLVVVAI